MKLPRLETLLVFAVLGCVALYGISTCSSKRARYQPSLDEEDRQERAERLDTVRRTNPAPPVQTPSNNTPMGPALTNANPATATKPVPPVQQTAKPEATKYTTLYVSIDGLNVRKTPGLKGETVAKLKLYEPVYFLNQKSEKTQEINLGYEKVTDYWVKVRTEQGKEGWVFGAGVNYYKTKRKGVLE